MKLNAPTYRNKKYAALWLSSMENHVLPMLGGKSIGSITSSDILSVLSPIWSDKHDTAKKIRQRLSQIMKWAKAQGYYTGDNPVELYPDSQLLFPNHNTGKPLSDNALRLALQKRFNLNTTTHGLRSSFKDWATETTNHANEVSEMALAHKISNAVEAAYRRGNLYEKRCQLMNDWADYLYGGENTVIQLVKG